MVSKKFTLNFDTDDEDDKFGLKPNNNEIAQKALRIPPPFDDESDEDSYEHGAIKNTKFNKIFESESDDDKTDHAKVLRETIQNVPNLTKVDSFKKDNAKALNSLFTEIIPTKYKPQPLSVETVVNPNLISQSLIQTVRPKVINHLLNDSNESKKIIF
jgi:hypothetical protein